MIIKTATGKEFECSAITENLVPRRLYLHIVGATIANVNSVFSSDDELPIEGYKYYDTVQSISSEGQLKVKVSLKKNG